MTNNYLMIQDNIVTNVCVWDGNTQTWTPPTDATMLLQSEIVANVWELDKSKTDFVLTPVLGAGQIGYEWNGTELTTNEPKPIPVVQPLAEGIQTV